MMGSEETEYVKPTITKTEWVERLNQTKFAKKDLNKLIMNFFLIEGIFLKTYSIIGYRDAAENFKKESGTDSTSFSQ